MLYIFVIFFVIFCYVIVTIKLASELSKWFLKSEDDSATCLKGRLLQMLIQLETEVFCELAVLQVELLSKSGISVGNTA